MVKYSQKKSFDCKLITLCQEFNSFNVPIYQDKLKGKYFTISFGFVDFEISKANKIFTKKFIEKENKNVEEEHIESLKPNFDFGLYATTIMKNHTQQSL